MWRERARCTGMHKHFTQDYRHRLPHTNLSQRRCALQLSFIRIRIEFVLLFFFRFFHAFARPQITVAMRLLLLTFNNLEHSPHIRCVNPDEENNTLLGYVFYGIVVLNAAPACVHRR